MNMTNKNGLTPLMAAVADDQFKCVKLLIQAGADVNKRDNEDDTALSIAGQFAHYNCLKVLLQAGAKINISNKTGRNALTIHITEKETVHQETAMLLYAAGEQLENKHIDSLHKDLKSIRLEHLCKEAIGKHLIHLDPHTHICLKG